MGSGFYLADQEADVDNEGFALPTPVGTTAVGNASDNDASTEQSAEADGNGDGVAHECRDRPQ